MNGQIFNRYQTSVKSDRFLQSLVETSLSAVLYFSLPHMLTLSLFLPAHNKHMSIR
ncbi:hypothetical protein CSC12_0775 [Klebsiella michiganensis]|nr:hypothetical protein CSC12_0775 [Klebsiella michiganensis]